MKKYIFLVLLVVPYLQALSQDEAKIKKVPTTYDRSSLGVFFFNNGNENHSAKFIQKVGGVTFPDKYNNNNFPSVLLKPNFNRAEATAAYDVKKLLEDQKVGLLTLALWYNRQPDGTMSMDVIHQRGRFSATDEDFLRAQTSKRGNAALEDYGNRLVNLSYILTIDVKDIKNVKELGMNNMKGWQANVTGYLYRINFSEDTQNAFYDSWIYSDDSPKVKEEKRKLFEKLNIPLELVTQQSIKVTASQPESTTGLGLLVKPKSEDELMQELAQKSLDELIYQIEMKVEEFKVKTAIHQVKPIRSKIGLKEGLKTDSRFFVYEFVWDEKLNQAIPKRRGVIRATSKIVDNRKEATGDMEVSTFYQVAGRKLEPGYTLQQQNDFGIEITPGVEVGGIGGLYARADLRLGRYLGMKATFVYVEGGIDAGEYFNEKFAFLRYGGGLAKGFQMSRNVELRPYAGVGIERANGEWLTNQSVDYFEVLYFKGGANLALNLKHNFQLVGGVGFYAPISKATDEDNNEYNDWTYYFEDRIGASTLLGIKIMF